MTKKGISTLKKKNLASLLNSAYSNQSYYEISTQKKNLDFWDQIYTKKVFPFKNRNLDHSY